MLVLLEIAVAALAALARAGKIEAKAVTAAIAELGVDPEKVDAAGA